MQLVTSTPARALQMSGLGGAAAPSGEEEVITLPSASRRLRTPLLLTVREPVEVWMPSSRTYQQGDRPVRETTMVWNQGSEDRGNKRASWAWFTKVHREGIEHAGAVRGRNHRCGDGTVAFGGIEHEANAKGTTDSAESEVTTIWKLFQHLSRRSDGGTKAVSTYGEHHECCQQRASHF